MTLKEPNEPWPEGWAKIWCACGTVIGGYYVENQPRIIEIQHQCTPQSKSYRTTIIHK